MATESYKGLWINPDFVLSRMGQVVQAHGRDKAGTGRFKHEREAYASALFALGLSQETNLTYWVEIETEDQTPDTKVHYLEAQQDGNHVWTHPIEVVDWTEYVDDPMELIRKKCTKAYPKEFILLVFARHGDKVISPEAMSEEIQRMKVPFFEIWILGALTEAKASMTRLHPSLFAIQYDVAEARSKARGFPHFLVRQKRGKGTELTDLGPIYLELP